MAEKEKKSQDSIESNSYNFMTNILADKNQRTKRLSFLGKFSSTPYAPFIRILVSIGLAFFTTIICMWYAFHKGTMVPYIAGQMFGIWISLMLIIFMYLLPSRNRSMLYSTVVYLGFKLQERFRRNSKAKADLDSFGIKEFYSDEDGLMLLGENEDPAYAYWVEGYLSKSIIPAVADEAASSRRSYNRIRSASTHLKMITSIKEADVTKQLKSLRDRWKEVDQNDRLDNVEKDWLKFQLDSNYYVIGQMSKDEYAASQMIFIIEEDGTKEDLDYAAQQWEMHADGSYARYSRVTSRKEITRELKRLTSLSKKGEQKYGKENFTKERLKRQ